MKRDALKSKIRGAKAAISFIFQIYNPAVIFTCITIFLLLRFFPMRFIPDFLGLSRIEKRQSIIWSLLSSTIGFSALIITIVLVAYNFYLKSTRRNTIEFIIENHWLKAVFTFFATNVSLCFLGFILTDDKDGSLVILYILLFTTFLYIIFLFPFAIMSLRYSTSMDRIEKVINTINDDDLMFLWRPEQYTSKSSLSHIERNKIIVLKDLGVNAIKEGDWVLPQRILNVFLDKIEKSPKSSSEDDLMKILFCYLFICKYFSRVALEHSDHITISALFANSVYLYSFLAVEKRYSFRNIDLDEFFKELCFNIIQSKDYSELRDSILKKIVSILEHSVSTIAFTDEEMPTSAYRMQVHMYDRNENTNEAETYWHYLTHTQIELLTSVIEYAISQKDERVYNSFNWQIHGLIRYVLRTKNLTDFQKKSYFDEVFFKVSSLTDFALSHDLEENINVISHLEIEGWIKNGERGQYNTSLYYYSSLLKKMLSRKRWRLSYIRDFNMVAITTISLKIDQQEKIAIISYILDTDIKLFELRYESPKVKYDLQMHITWVFNIMAERNELAELKFKYSDKVLEICQDYTQENYPY